MAPTWTELLERNRVYAETKHKPQLFISQPGFEPPAVFIFSCIDFRTLAEAFLYMKGDEAFVVRNLGGRITTSLHALLFVETFTQGQALKDVVIIHHLDCGCTHNTEEGLRDILKAKNPDQAAEVDKIIFGAYLGNNMQQHKEAVRSDINFLKASPLVRKELKERVHGYIYDFQSGKLIPVSNADE